MFSEGVAWKVYRLRGRDGQQYNNVTLQQDGVQRINNYNFVGKQLPAG